MCQEDVGQYKEMLFTKLPSATIGEPRSHRLGHGLVRRTNFDALVMADGIGFVHSGDPRTKAF